MLRISVILLSALIINNVLASNTTQPTKLKMLALYQKFAANANTSACMAAMQVAIAAVNSKPSPILPDYVIDVSYADEGPLGINSPRAVVDFLRESSQNDSGSMLAPAVVGMFGFCNTVTDIILSQDMVQFATGCGGAIFIANRQRFPNLYKTITPNEVYVVSMLVAIKEIGRWKRVGMIHGTANQNEFIWAAMFTRQLNQAGVDVPWFYTASAFDSAMVASIKTANIRIIASTIVDSYQTVIRFFCALHQGGIKPPQYFFVIFWSVNFDPSGPINPFLTPGCSREDVTEMVRATFWYGKAVDKYVTSPTRLGYTAQEFDEQVTTRLAGIRPSDIDRRYICHDAMAYALLSMHEAELQLVAHSNSSLRDFGTKPKLVMNTLNATAARETGFAVLRQGLTLSDRLEIDYIPQVVRQWIDGKFEIIANCDANNSVSDGKLPKMYTLVREPAWNSIGLKRAPKDLSNVLIERDLLPLSFQITIYVMAATFSVGKLPLYSVLISKHTFSWISLEQVLLSIGTLLANAAAVAYALQYNSALKICHIQLALKLLGALFISTGLALATTNLYHKADEGSNSSRQTAINDTQFTFRSRNTRKMARLAVFGHKTNVNPKWRRRVAQLSGTLWIMVYCILLALWLAIDSSVGVVVNKTPVLFDSTKDDYVSKWSVRCNAPSSFHLALSFSILIPLLFAAFLGYAALSKVRHYHHHSNVGSRNHQHIQTANNDGGNHQFGFIRAQLRGTTVAVLNAITSFGAAILLGMILEDSSNLSFAAMWSSALIILANLTEVAILKPLCENRNLATSRGTEFQVKSVSESHN